MRTAASSDRDADLTARARIIAAATEIFATQGYRAATVRAIAAHAGVSPALVIHHFGDKEALRRECDERVLRFLTEKSRGDLSAAAVLDTALREYGPYLARMLTDDSDEARALFDRLLDLARDAVRTGTAGGTVRPSADPDAQAMAMIFISVAPFFAQAHVARWAGGDFGDGIARLAVPVAEIYTHGLVIGGRLTDAAASAAANRTAGTR